MYATVRIENSAKISFCDDQKLNQKLKKDSAGQKKTEKQKSFLKTENIFLSKNRLIFHSDCSHWQEVANCLEKNIVLLYPTLSFCISIFVAQHSYFLQKMHIEKINE